MCSMAFGVKIWLLAGVAKDGVEWRCVGARGLCYRVSLCPDSARLFWNCAMNVNPTFPAKTLLQIGASYFIAAAVFAFGGVVFCLFLLVAAIAELKDGRSHEATLFSALAMFVCWIGCWSLIYLGKRVAKDRISIRDFGIIRSARVVRYERMWWRTFDGSPTFSAIWLDEDGIQGRSFGHWVRKDGVRLSPSAIARAGLPPVDGQITIYADPRSRSFSFWEGDVGTRLPDPSHRPV